MMRLGCATLDALPAWVQRPGYDRGQLPIGVLHFGPGAFHRAHQAAYFDSLCAFDARWGICAVALHSSGVRDALAPQDGLYTMALLDAQPQYRVIGALRELLVAPENPAAVFERLARPAIEIVTTTVTEKGYCLRADGTLDPAHPDILHDLQQPHAPRSVLGYLVQGLAQRYRAGTPPFVLVPCDNLPHNGARLKAALVVLAGHTDVALADRISVALECPDTMVDAITPATDDALRSRVAAATGLSDAWPVQREAFAQWVIGSHGHIGGPDWARVGVTLTDDVGALERTKLWVLNGAHSTLAYLGWLKGHETVADAIADPALHAAVRSYLLQDIVPLLQAALADGAPEPTPGAALHGYVDATLRRFANPAIQHRLAQIACDGSQKLPVRVLQPLRLALAGGADVARFGLPLAAWLRFVRRMVQQGQPLVDPLAGELAALGRAMQDRVEDVDLALTKPLLFPADLAADARVRQAVSAAYVSLLRAQ